MSKSKITLIAVTASTVVILAILVIVFAVSRGGAQQRRISGKDYNLIVISITNLAAGHMSLYGYSRKTTPNLDKFASQSIVFNDAFSQASWTLPSGTTVFTGEYPYTHDVMNRYDGSSLDTKTETLAKILKQNGYKTAAFTGGGDYDRQFGLDQGYDTYDDSEQYGGISKEISQADKWLETNKNQKFFLFVQGYDPHCPYTPPKPYDTMFDPGYKGKIDFSTCLWTFEDTKPIEKDGRQVYELYRAIQPGQVGPGGGPPIPEAVYLDETDVKHMVALYDGEVAYSDSLIKRFLDQIQQLGLNDNTIVVFLSEHGDMFGKHGRFMRGGPLRGTFYDDVIHIPLIVRVPGVKPKRINGLAQLVDFMPTVLNLLDISVPSQVQGKSLLPLMENGRTVNDYVYGGSQYKAVGNVFFDGFSSVETIRSKDWKLIRETIKNSSKEPNSTKYQLYNLKKDPEELNNLFDSDPSTAIELKNKLLDWVDTVKRK